MSAVGGGFVPAYAAAWPLYVAATLVLTAEWVPRFAHRPFAFLALAMFFPGAVAIAFEAAAGGLGAFAASVLAASTAVATWAAVGALVDVATVGAAGALGVMLGRSSRRGRRPPAQPVAACWCVRTVGQSWYGLLP